MTLNELELEPDLEDPRDRIAYRAKKRREKEAWEWEQADRDYDEQAADEYWQEVHG